MKTKNKNNKAKRIKSILSTTKRRSIRIFHTFLGFRLIKLPEGVEDGDAGMITPSGFIFKHPVITYIINR